MLSFSDLLWEKISELIEEDEIMKAERSNIPSEIEWTDINIELLPNEFDDELPFLRTFQIAGKVWSVWVSESTHGKKNVASI